MISTLITNNDWIEYLGIYGKKKFFKNIGMLSHTWQRNKTGGFKQFSVFKMET